MPELLSYQAAADSLNVSKSTIIRLVKAGELPVIRIRRSVRIDPLDLEQYQERKAKKEKMIAEAMEALNSKAERIRGKSKPTQLYRFYNEEEQLLYVGVSKSTIQRLFTHQKLSDWYILVRFVVVDNYADRKSALAAERDAIKTEKPFFNIQHNA